MGYKVNKRYIGTQQVRPSDILLYMPMNSDLLDHSGNNIAVQNTGVSLVSNVLSGRNVASFAGVDTNNYLIFDLGKTPTECTVTFWIKSTKNKSGYFASYNDPSGGDYIVMQAENTGVYFSCTVWNANRISSRTLPFDGNWHKITMTRGGGTFKLYVDKTLLGSNSYTQGGAITKFNFGGPLWDGAGWVYGGYMAEAKMIGKVLDSTEISTDYDNEKSIFGIS